MSLQISDFRIAADNQSALSLTKASREPAGFPKRYPKLYSRNRNVRIPLSCSVCITQNALSDSVRSHRRVTVRLDTGALSCVGNSSIQLSSFELSNQSTELLLAR